MIETLIHTVDTKGTCLNCGTKLKLPANAKELKITTFENGQQVGLVIGEHCGDHSYFVGKHNTAPNCK